MKSKVDINENNKIVIKDAKRLFLSNLKSKKIVFRFSSKIAQEISIKAIIASQTLVVKKRIIEKKVPPKKNDNVVKLIGSRISAMPTSTKIQAPIK